MTKNWVMKRRYRSGAAAAALRGLAPTNTGSPSKPGGLESRDSAKHTSSAEERRAGEGYRPFAVDVAGAVVLAPHRDCRRGLGRGSIGARLPLVIAMMVAMLLGGFCWSPTAMLLRKKGVRAGGTAAIAELARCCFSL